jgi:hypothetical protein
MSLLKLSDKVKSTLSVRLAFGYLPSGSKRMRFSCLHSLPEAKQLAQFFPTATSEMEFLETNVGIQQFPQSGTSSTPAVSLLNSLQWS